MYINEDNVYSEEYETTSYNVDWDYKANLNFIFSLIQDVGGTHAYYRDCSVPQLQAENMTWVITRSAIEIMDYPTWPEKIDVKTWAMKSKGYNAPRGTRIFNKKGDKLVEALSYWAIIDFEKKRPIKPESIQQNQALTVNPDVKQYQVPLFKGKIKEFSPDLILMSSYEPSVFPSDSDYNGHTNNISYLNWMVNAFSQDFIKNRLARKVDIVWRKETHYTDSLRVSTYCLNPDSFNNVKSTVETFQKIEIIGKDGSKTVCSEAVITWENRNYFYPKDKD
ncbi:MAG: acyl-ACP thioesterase domain-containing protein [Sphaerochaetaceae bacterium]